MPVTPRNQLSRRTAWFFSLGLCAWLSVAGLLTYSYAGAAPAKPATAAVQGASAQVASAGTSHAAQLSDAFASVAERVSPSVVTIKVESKQASPALLRMPFFGMPRGEQDRRVKGGGSGVVFRRDGVILTNNHVVENATRIDVQLRDGRTFRAKVLGRDPAVDLAVLKIDAKDLPAAGFADSSKARVGEWVLAIGAPFGLDYTLTAGVLSAKGRGVGANEIEDYLQTDASINPGNSGGPLVDLDGRVLGINTMIIGGGTGIGFAIPASIARNVGEQLLANGQVRRAWLGVSFQELSPEIAQRLGKSDTHGALVSSVVAKGPAAAAGIVPGDIIERVDESVVTEGKDLLRAVLAKPVGAQVQLAVRRDGKMQSLKLKLAERPTELRAGAELGQAESSGGNAVQSELGLRLQALTPEIARALGYRGDGKIVIADVRQGSPADRAGLERGDVIVEADRRGVQNAEDVQAALRDGSALLRVERQGGSFFTMLDKD